MRNAVWAGLLVAVAASAQEGFPLDGTWRAEGKAADGSHETIVIIMQWDGKQVSGIINPGASGVEFNGAQLNPEGWTVLLAAKDAKGIELKLEGALADLGKYNRVINGRWTEGGRSQDIRFVRE